MKNQNSQITPSPFKNEIAQKKIAKTQKIIDTAKQAQTNISPVYTPNPTPITVPTISEYINQLARQATVGTLKRIHTASGNDKIMQFRINLQKDFAIIDGKSDNKNDTISDAYDCYIVAYEYLWEQIAVNKLSAIDTIDTTMKNGKIKTRSIYQMACTKVRQYIYSNKAIESNGKYVYIEDMRHGEDDTFSDVLDREYIRLGRYSHIADDGEYGITASYNDYDVINNKIDKMDLSRRQVLIVEYRLKGLSLTDIAKKLGVTTSAISQNLNTIQKIYTAKFPIIE